MKLKLKLSVSTDKVGSEVEETVEIDAADLAGLDEEGREKLFAEYLRDHINNHTDSWWEIVEGEE